MDVFDLATMYLAAHRVIEWAIECNFGYDNVPVLYEQYADEIEKLDLDEATGLIYLALMEKLEEGN